MKRFLALIIIAILFVCVFFLDKTNLNLIIQNSGVCVDKFVVCGNSQVLELKSLDYSKVKNILNLEIVESNEIAGRTIIEGYSNKLKNYFVVNNRKVNIQISICDDKMTIGYPLIAGSF